MGLKTSRRRFVIGTVGAGLATQVPGCATAVAPLPEAAARQGFRRNKFGATSTAEEVTARLDLSSMTVLVTGANSGLGFETMRVLALRGAHVLAAARSMHKATQAAAKVVGKVTPLVCELTDFDSVAACADTVAGICQQGTPLDALICNAGVMGGGELQTVLDLERQFVVNYLGHFLLTQRLLGVLEAAPQGRIVLVSSGLYTKAPAVGIDFDNLAGEHSYERFTAYGQSKLAVALFATELARRLAGTRVSANALYPGVISTNLFRDMPWYMRAGIAAGGWAFMKSVEEGAATQCYVATAPALAQVSGLLFADCNPVVPEGPHVANDVLAAKLWRVSEQLVDERLNALP